MSDPFPPPYAGPPPAAPPAVPPAVPPPPPMAPGYAGPVPGYAAQPAGYPGPVPMPGYAQPTPGAGAPATQGPRTLAIVGIALAWFLPPAGLVVSLVALAQSRPGQQARRLAIVGIVASIVLTVVYVLFFIMAGNFLDGLREVMEGEMGG